MKDLAIIIEDYHELENLILYLFDEGESITYLRKFVKKYIKKEIIAEFKKFFNNNDIAGEIIKEYYRRKVIQLYYDFDYSIDQIYWRFRTHGRCVDKPLQRLFKTENYVEEIINIYNEKESD